MRPCFVFNSASDTEATLEIYDEIGFWGVQAKDFIRQLKAVKAPVLNVSISSPGGDVFAGIAIYNALRESGKEVVVKVLGMAASAASLIAMAGDKIIMPKNSFMMIHNPWSFAAGDADELRKQAKVLDQIGSSLVATYAARTGMAEDELKVMLAEETWLTADEAVAKGFATEIAEAVEVKAKFDMDRADLPAHVKAAYLAVAAPVVKAEVEEAPAEEQPVVEPVLEATQTEAIEALANSAGMEAYAAVWAVSGLDLDTVRARIKDAREIKALSVVARKPERAAVAIKAGTSVADFRASLVTALAEEDEASHTDGTPSKNTQQAGSTEKPPVSSQSLWASHNKAK